MFPLPTNRGFTLIELLVTLVILGLTAALVGPNIFSWLRSREAASQRNTIEQALALVPLEAALNGKEILIQQAADIGVTGIELSFPAPVRILKNGYCTGGEAILTLDSVEYKYTIMPPFCRVTLQ